MYLIENPIINILKDENLSTPHPKIERNSGFLLFLKYG